MCCSSLKQGHCDNRQSAFQAVLDCKLEATAEPLPNSEAPEPKSPPPSILHSVVSNHILAKCHRSAQLEQISKAAKQSLGSKCMFSESCLHCYQMRLPHTNQINQQLPIFINLPGHRLILTSIELHQVFVNNRGDLRAPRNQCQTGSRILQMSIHSTLFQLHYGPP